VPKFSSAPFARPNSSEKLLEVGVIPDAESFAGLYVESGDRVQTDHADNLATHQLVCNNVTSGSQLMFATKRLASFDANSSGGAVIASPIGRSETSDRKDQQNWLAFVVILLLSVLVFLLGGALATDTSVRQADLTADIRN
jgi:hypothetical protein